MTDMTLRHALAVARSIRWWCNHCCSYTFGARFCGDCGGER